MKLHCLYILLLLCLVACTADEASVPSDSPEPRAIGLSAYTPRPVQSRADAALLADRGIPDGQSIGVFAYYHSQGTWTDEAAPNFMFNQQAENRAADDAFVYAPLKYWPNTEADKVSFIAYYPYTDYPGDAPYGEADPQTATGIKPQLARDGVGLPSFLFTVDDDKDRQVDFLVSGLLADLPRTRDTEADPGRPFNDLTVRDRIRFYFQHMTAKVEFRIVIDPAIRPDVAYFTLRSLSLTNICTQGLLTPSYDTETGLTSFAWTAQKTPHDYTAWQTDETYLLLPQPLRDEARLQLDYAIGFGSDGTTYQYDALGNPVTTETYSYANHKATVQLNTLKVAGTGTALTEWLPNRHYIYTIRLGAHRIDFTGEVVEWGEYEWSPLS